MSYRRPPHVFFLDGRSTASGPCIHFPTTLLRIMALQLPELPYSKDALAPHINQQTLEVHHGKHHNAYVVNGNKLIDGTEYADMSTEDIIKATAGKADKAGVFNNASQHWNHILFWQCMKPQGGGAIPGELEKRLVDSFGSVDEFKGQFAAKGAGQFGSGWAWLVSTANGKLEVTSTPNGVNPLCFDGQKALLGCDVWEHSYYIDYRNRRPDYLKAFLDNMVNWEFVAQQL